MLNHSSEKPADDADLSELEFCQANKPIRALLIQPSSEGAVRSLLSEMGEDHSEFGFKPPIGLLYVATMLKERSTHDLKVIDAMAMRLSIKDTIELAKEYKPQIVGISAWTDYWYPAYKTGEGIKKAMPDVHLTYGGPHIGIFSGQTLDLPFVDSVIAGDGEVPFLCLCNMISNGNQDNRMPGLHFKQWGVKLKKETFYIQKNLDALPIPDRTLLPSNLYKSVLGKSDMVTTMITSRGCPFKCTFCKLTFQKCLCRSAENVVEEFRAISKLGIREVEVYDDTFTWSAKRVVDICQGLVKSGVQVKWAVRDRVSGADAKLLELMRKAGCERIHYGIESGVDRVIERMKKNITTSQAKAAVEMARRSGMTVLAFFMFGNLDESIEDMENTIEFAMKLDPDYAEFSITIPYPGTAIYREALETGIISHDYWGEYSKNPVPDFSIPELIESHADYGMLLKIRDKAVRRFYFRPRYLIRQLQSVNSFHEFARKARMGRLLLRSLLKRSPGKDGKPPSSDML